MPRSVHSMMRHGLISTKAYNATLAKTRSQKSKMTEFDAKSKDEGSGKGRGAVAASEINQHKHQRAGSAIASKPTRGGGVVGSNPHTDAGHINKPSNNKRFPPGGTAPGKGGTPMPPARTKGTVIQPGPYYGGGGRRG